MLHGFVFHAICLRFFAWKNIFSLNIAVHHDNRGFIVRIITNKHRHCIKSYKLTRMSPSVSCNNFIAALSSWSCNTRHQGSRAGGLTLDELGGATGESAKTVQRYIWISRLSELLFDMVDSGKIGIMQAVDISFLSEDAQQWVLVAIQDTNAVITKQQSAMLKESDKKGELTFPMVRMLLEKEKPVERKVVIKTERINSYFPDTYSTDDIEKIIFQLLDNWKNTQ
jgi:hypothetical protein